MSFTKDELQSFSTLIDQKLTRQRHEIERSFDARLQIALRSLEQHLINTKHDILRTLSQQLAEHYKNMNTSLSKKIDVLTNTNPTTTSQDFSEMELHTELPLEDLAQSINQLLDERFAALQTELMKSITEIDQYPTGPTGEKSRDALSSGSLSSIHSVVESVERLEQLIESMQVAMTANQALLVNRVYHHQQLPLERAHPSSTDTTRTEETTKSSLSLPKYT